MNFLNLIAFSMSFILFAFSAYGAEDTPEIIPVPKNAIYQDSSEHNRIGKKFFVGLKTGVGPNNFVQSGWTASYFIDRNTLIEGAFTSEAMTGSTSYVWSSINGYEYYSRQENRSKTYALYLKKFAGNSFYYKFGLEHGTVLATQTDSYDATRTYSYEGGNLMGAFAIGNQWQWSNFSLGCDWIGLSAPLTTWTNKKTVGSDRAQRDLDSELDYHLNETTVQLLHFYVGFSF